MDYGYLQDIYKLTCAVEEDHAYCNLETGTVLIDNSGEVSLGQGATLISNALGAFYIHHFVSQFFTLHHISNGVCSSLRSELQTKIQNITT